MFNNCATVAAAMDNGLYTNGCALFGGGGAGRYGAMDRGWVGECCVGVEKGENEGGNKGTETPFPFTS